MSNLNELFSKLKGGIGSGNFGHSGIPGRHGGSAPGGGGGRGGSAGGSGGGSATSGTGDTLNKKDNSVTVRSIEARELFRDKIIKDGYEKDKMINRRGTTVTIYKRGNEVIELSTNSKYGTYDFQYIPPKIKRKK